MPAAANPRAMACTRESSSSKLTLRATVPESFADISRIASASSPRRDSIADQMRERCGAGAGGAAASS